MARRMTEEEMKHLFQHEKRPAIPSEGRVDMPEVDMPEVTIMFADHLDLLEFEDRYWDSITHVTHVGLRYLTANVNKSIKMTFLSDNDTIASILHSWKDIKQKYNASNLRVDVN